MIFHHCLSLVPTQQRPQNCHPLVSMDIKLLSIRGGLETTQSYLIRPSSMIRNNAIWIGSSASRQQRTMQTLVVVFTWKSKQLR